MSTGVIEWQGRVGSTAISSDTPVTQRIVDDIRGRIASGQLKPGDKLLSINDMREAYKCSDTPIKAALKELHWAGLVYSQAGRGTFVGPKP